MLIDSHCHLDFDVLANDLDGVLARMDAAGVDGCVAISTWVHEYDILRKIAEAHKNIWFTIGTHPCNAHGEPVVKAAELIRLAEHPKCIGFGEAGLDYFHDASTAKVQKESFRQHIMAARETGLPLVIHARNADEDMETILKEETEQGAFPFVLHCFSSTARLAKVGLELGGYLSFSGIVTFKNAIEVLEIANNCPDNRIFVETDAPYLAPMPFRGKSNEPSYVKYTAEHLAVARCMDFEEFSTLTTANFSRLFSKAGL